MTRSKTLSGAALTAALFVSLPLFAAQPYHLELEASPGAVFPYLGRFGDVRIHVYAGGVRAEALWLNGISRNAAANVTVMNPLGRMYVDVPLSDIAPILARLVPSDAIERQAKPVLNGTMKGRVGNIAATRYRLQFDTAWIDLWMTEAIPENRQFRRITQALLAGISPGTASVASTIPGTPVYVELNFRRFKRVPLLKVKKLTMSADDEEDALTRGPVYVRATVLEKLFERTK